MARNTKKQPQQATVAEEAANQATTAEAAKAAASIKLSDEVKAKAAEFGHAIGAYAREKDNAAEAYRQAALMLFDLKMEGYVGLVNPRAENFVSTIALEAWATKYPGMEYKPSQDQVMNNTLSHLRRIAKGISLHGFVHRDGHPIPCETILRRILEGYTDAEGKVKAGAFNPAQMKALEWIKIHDKLCTTDAEYAKAVNYTPPANGKSNRGRERVEPSETRMEKIIDDASYMLRPQCEAIIKAATDRAISLLSANAKAPSYSNVVTEIRAASDKLLELLKGAGSKLAAEIIDDSKTAARAARDDAASKAVAHAKTATHTDEVTSKRKGKATRKAGKPAAIRESMPMQQTA